MTTLPPMHGIASLGVSGPFAHDSQQLWAFALPSHARLVELSDAPGEALGLSEAPDVAEQVALSLVENGAERVWVADAWGGRKGLARVWWEVRVTRLRTAARPFATTLYGDSSRPILGGRLASICEASPDAVVAVWINRTPPWKRTVGRSKIGAPLQVRGEESSVASAVLAVGNVLASVTACAPAGVEADLAAARLAEVALTDLRETEQREEVDETRRGYL